MPRKARYDEKQLGSILISARDRGIPWVNLVSQFGLCRARLCQIWCKAKNDKRLTCNYQGSTSLDSVDVTSPVQGTNLELGAKLIEERAAGVSWKVLMRRYGYGRSRLVQFFNIARALNQNQSSEKRGSEDDVYEHLERRQR